MSDRITSASAPGIGGISLSGRKTRAEAIQAYRDHYEAQREQAETALAMSDDDIRVQTYLGVWAMKNVEDVTE